MAGTTSSESVVQSGEGGEGGGGQRERGRRYWLSGSVQSGFKASCADTHARHTFNTRGLLIVCHFSGIKKAFETSAAVCAPLPPLLNQPLRLHSSEPPSAV